MTRNLGKCRQMLKKVKVGDVVGAIALLEDDGVDVNYAEKLTRSGHISKNAIAYAADHGHEQLVKILLEKGADANCNQGYSFSPLFYAIEAGHTQVALALVQNGRLRFEERQHSIYSLGSNALLHSLDKKLFDVTHGLLQAGAFYMHDTVYRYCSGTVFLKLIHCEDISIVKEFASNYRSVWENNMHMKVALCDSARAEVLEVFFEAGADSNGAFRSNYENLHKVKRHDPDETLRVRKFFLEKICNLKKDDIAWIYPGNKNNDLNQFLEQGNDINMRGALGITPLMIAAQLDEGGLVGRMIKAGADITAINEFGGTALTMAVRAEKDMVVERLVLESRHRLFLDAVLKNDVEAVSETVHLRQIDVNHADENGKNALMHACENENMEMAEVILSKMQWTFDLFHKYESVAPVEIRADINAKDKKGDTALGISCKSNNIEVAKMLLSNNADINAQNCEGNTALMIACSNKNAEMVNLLINFSQESVIKICRQGKVKYDWRKILDINIENDAGQTALMLSYTGVANGDVIESLLDLYPENTGPFDMYGREIYDHEPLFDAQVVYCHDDFAPEAKKQRTALMRQYEQDEVLGIDDQQEVQLLPRADFWSAYAEDAP